ncbi:MAG: MATE family efflux transporter [Clostridia bacterium]|nr:MATE family efflux transporter [Clostridia bacterium]
MRRKMQVDFLEGGILKNVILFAIPLILSGILQLLFNAADIIVVGNFAGSHEMGAVGSTGSTTNLLISIGIGLSVGLNVVVAQSVGAGNREMVQRSVHTGMCLSLAVGLALGMIGYFCAASLLRLLSTPLDIIDSATVYLRAYCMGIPFNIIYNFGSAVLRANGDTRRPLFFMTIAGVVNVVLNIIFVRQFHLGALGVGIATAISQFVSATLVVCCLLTEQSVVQLCIKKLRFHKEETFRIMMIGLPAGIQSSLFAISNMLIQSSVNSFGADAVAGNSAVMNLEGFIYIAMNSIYQTIVTFTAQNRGAGKYQRVNKGLVVSMGCVIAIGVILGSMFQIFPRELISLYTRDEKAILYGLIRVPFFALPYCLCGLMETIMGAVRGLGYSMMPLITSLLGSCFFRIAWVQTVFAQHRTLQSLYLSYPISWALTASIHLACFLLVRKKAFQKNTI